MGANDLIRYTLNKLIEESNANFSADDVLREFRCTKDKRSDRKLLKVLDIVSKNQPQRVQHLTEATLLLKNKDPMYVLMVFLNNYIQSGEKLTITSSGNMLQSVRKRDISTSTPLITTKPRNDITPDISTGSTIPHAPHAQSTEQRTRLAEVTPEEVLEIKERVLNAVGCTISTRSNHHIPIASSSAGSATTIPPTTNGTTSKANAGKTSGDAHSSEVPTSSTRTHSLWDFYKIDNCGPKQSIAGIPISSQEHLLMYDVIHCLTGMRGCYIQPSDDSLSSNASMSGSVSIDNDSTGAGAAANDNTAPFKISEDIQSFLRDIAMEILPLAMHYICIQKFVEKAQEPDAGQVLQALSASLTNLVHDYYRLLAQLESELMENALTLHKMLFYLRPTMKHMEVIASTLKDIMTKKLRGAAALTLLFNKCDSLTGDEESQSFIIILLQHAAEPYMNILQLWMQKGVIVDPGQEFLVEDSDKIREELPEHYSSDYWEKRYAIRRDRIPCFLEKVSDIILRTGKYLNVIRQCGKKVTPPQKVKLEFVLMKQNHIKVIEDCYSFASKTLLEVLLKENDLMGHLMSVKRYLLLNQGDFIMQFMDACEDQLSKNVDQVLPMTLENLLGLTLRLSSARNDAYKDDLHCELLTYDLVTQMSKIMSNEEEYSFNQEGLDLNGLECFAFTYAVNWPVSLVLNHISISKYQMLFRQLFYCKHVERQLCKIWKENGIVKKFTAQAANLYRSAFTLRQRMKNAIQNLEYYMMVEIIEPNWHIFLEKMKKVENVDEVLALHQDFLDSCLKNCMLTETTVLNRFIFKICKICLKFCEFIQRLQHVFHDAELKSMVCDSNDEDTDNSYSEHNDEHANPKQIETALQPTETFAECVKRFDFEFTNVLVGFLQHINDVSSQRSSDCFMNLVHRMNFNYFYSEQMEKLSIKDDDPVVKAI